MEIKKTLKQEREGAMKLVWNVFSEFEAPDYVDEGINTFRDFITSEDELNGLEIYSAYEKENIVGVIATRNQGNHIALFFVDKKHHRQGIGRKLFEVALKNSTSGVITVNSSPYAKEVYHKLGFSDTDVEQTTDGLRYIPMRYEK